MCLDNFNVSSKKTAIETKYREILPADGKPNLGEGKKPRKKPAPSC